MIPRDELRLLVVTFADATERAERGAIAWGLRALEAGLTRARRAENAGEPWARQLLEQWQERDGQFRARFMLSRSEE